MVRATKPAREMRLRRLGYTLDQIRKMKSKEILAALPLKDVHGRDYTLAQRAIGSYIHEASNCDLDR